MYEHPGGKSDTEGGLMCNNASLLKCLIVDAFLKRTYQLHDSNCTKVYKQGQVV